MCTSGPYTVPCNGRGASGLRVCMCVRGRVSVCVYIISRVHLAIRVLGQVLFRFPPHCISVGYPLMCCSDHRHSVRGQKHFLIASHTSV